MSKIGVAVIVAVFLFTTGYIDFAWAGDSNLRPVTLGEDSAKARKLKEALQDSKTKAFDTEANSKGQNKNKNELVEYQSTSPQTLILYAEPLLGNEGLIDSEDTLQVLITGNVLETIVIYAEELGNANILEKQIRGINPYLRIIRIMKEELLPDYSEAEKVDALIKLAEANGIKQENILCVLKGTVERREALKNLAKKRGIPILVFKDADGEDLYSIAEVIRRSKSAQKIFNSPADI